MLTRLRFSLARTLLKGMALPTTSPWVRATFLEPSFDLLVSEGYRKNAVVASCITALVRTFPEPPLLVYRDEAPDAAPLPTHPLRRLIRRPNGLMGEDELWQYLIAYTAIGGNAYAVAPLNSARQPVELWPYHAAQVRPVPGGDQWIAGYEFLNDVGTWKRLDPARYLVCHFKWPLPDPDQPWLAQPPLRAAARSVDTTAELDTYVYSLLRNDAVPRGVLELPADAALTESEYTRMERMWAEKHGGGRRGGVAILEGGAKYTRIALNIQELAVDALRGTPEKYIAAALGVPLSVAGVGDDPTYANSEEAYNRFTRSTLAPLWRSFAAEVESTLGQAFGGVVCRHDLSVVKAFQEDENQRWARITNAFTAGLISLQAAQAALGYRDPQPDDLFVAPIARELLPYSQLIAPAPEPAPAPPALPAPQPEQGQRSRGAKAKRDGARVARSLQRARARVARRMEPAIDRWFGELADTIVSRAGKAKALPGLDDLIAADDFLSLERTIVRFNVELVRASWETWNTALDVDVAFELSDPAVVAAQKQAGRRITDITETTRDAVRRLLSEGAEQGWTIGQLVAGSEDRPGLRTLIEQTYKGRATTIARTELGEAQQAASVARYHAAKVGRVLVLDNGSEDSDPRCTELNGTVQTLAWAKANPLQHPNCVRCFAPYFEEDD